MRITDGNGIRYKSARDYSAGSLRDQIHKATQYEHLDEVRAYIRMVGSGMSAKTRRKLEAAIRRQELMLPSQSKLLIPRDAGQLIVPAGR